MKRIKYVIIMLSLIIVGLTATISAYLLDTGSTEPIPIKPIAFVKVKQDLHFVKDGARVEKPENGDYAYVSYRGENLEDLFKNRIYDVNVSNTDSKNYIKNLRIDIEVHSNVDTYIRVRIVDQLTLYADTKNNDGEDIIREYSQVITRREEPYQYGSNMSAEILAGEPYLFADDWYAHTDGYFYYKNAVQATVDGFLRVNFITGYDPNFVVRNQNYGFQIGLEIEAVQAYLGAKENWNMDQMPWM